MAKSSWLTKSRFMAGSQCPKRLWLQSHGFREVTDAGTPEIATGDAVGSFAQALFPGGVSAGADNREIAATVARTRQLLTDSAVPAVFEAMLVAGKLLARTDALERLPDRTWKLCKVKGSTAVKPEHIDDVAFQLHVARKLGLRIRRIEIIHVNRNYLRGTDGIDPVHYFSRVDVTREANSRSKSIPAHIVKLTAVMLKQTAPKVEPWGFCHSPYSCEFWEHCTKDKPDDWIYYLPRMKPALAGRLRRKGIESIAQIPPRTKLTASQSRIVAAHRTGAPYLAHRLEAIMQEFEPPTFYLDFETISPAIPLYPGTCPYQRIPVQWSLHEKMRRGELRHKDFIADFDVDPRDAFANSLITALGNSKTPILVYSGFEKSTLTELARDLPHFRKQIKRIIARLADLLSIVRGNVYYPAFGGSFSIKSVAPALTPSIRYDGEVCDGGTASVLLEQLASGQCDGDAEKIRTALRDYCQRDTLALAAVHSALLNARAAAA